MSPYEILQPGGSVEYNNEEPGAEWLQRLTHAFPKYAWINPEPQGVWQYRQSIAIDPAADEPAHVPAHAGGPGSGDAAAEQMTRRVRLARALALLGLLLALAGCACWPTARQRDVRHPRRGDSAPAASTGADTEPAALVVDAPVGAAALLERNLDIARARRTGGTEATRRDRVAAPGRRGAGAGARVAADRGLFRPRRARATRARAALRLVRVRGCPGRAPRSRVSVECTVGARARRRRRRGRARTAQATARLRGRCRRARPSATPTGRREDGRAGASCAPPATRPRHGPAAPRRSMPTNNQVQLLLVADSGPLFRAGELPSRACSCTTRAVRNLAGFAPGAPLTEHPAARLPGAAAEGRPVRDHRRHASTPTRRRPRRGGDRRSCTRRRCRSLALGVGVSANTGPRVTVEHTHRRVFGYAADRCTTRSNDGREQACERRDQHPPGRELLSHMLGGRSSVCKRTSTTCCRSACASVAPRTRNRIERLYFVGSERSARDDLRHRCINDTDASARIPRHLAPARQRHPADRGFTCRHRAASARATAPTPKTGPFTRLYGRLTGYLPLGESWYGKARARARPGLQAGRRRGARSQLGFAPAAKSRCAATTTAAWRPRVDGASAAATCCSPRASRSRARSATLPAFWWRGVRRRRPGGQRAGKASSPRWATASACAGAAPWARCVPTWRTEKSYTKCVCTCRWALRSRVQPKPS